MGIHKPFGGYRRALYMGASLSTFLIFSLPAHAQSTFDPFSPTTVAPIEPSAAPNAPAPKARYIPDPTPPSSLSTPQAAPVQAVESAPLQAPAPKLTAEPAPQRVTEPTTKPSPVESIPPARTAQTTAPTGEPTPSFWDKFTNIFSEDTPSEKKSMFKENAQGEEIKAQPVKEEVLTTLSAEPVITPASLTNTQTQVSVETPRAVQTAAPTSPPAPAPAPVAIPQVAIQGDPNNPFTSANVAPALPGAVPEAPQPAPITPPVMAERPATTTTFETPSSSASTQAEPVVEKVIEAAKAEQTAEPVKQNLAQDTTPEPSFWNKLGNLFTSEPQEKNTLIQTVEAETPTQTPAPTPAPQVAPAPTVVAQNVTEIEDSPGFFGKIGNFFSETFSATPDEDGEKEPTHQPVSEPEQTKEQTTPVVVPQTQPARPVDPRLLKANLGLGRDIKLGQSDDALSKDARCFTKNRGTVTFCTTPTRWPDKIAKHFDVSTHLYKGAKGIVQFDGALATRLFALFKSNGFDEIVSYFEQQYGPATNTFVRETRLLKKDIENKSVIWLKSNTSDGLTEVMEIRQFSDMRGPRTDLENGTIRVYFEGSREIFSLTSDLDYMNLR